MEGGCHPHSVEEVFQDFEGRRTGLINALTTDVEEFFQQCDPEKVNLCLYGYPSGQWEVSLPTQQVPSTIPEPALGINFARDGLKEKDWLSLIAIHSDAWLLAVSFCFGALFGFDKAERNQLFDMINELPTVFEEVTKRWGEKASVSRHSSDQHKPNSTLDAYPESQPKDAEEGLDGEEEEDDTLCGACQQNYASDEFWIFCEFCERWFHGQCVKITPERAEQIEKYKCHTCSNKRTGA